jgi:hypothetical protein
MKTLDLSRYVLCSCAIAALLAGCGGSQPPIGTPGAMQQFPTSHVRNAHGSAGDLLYTSGFESRSDGVDVFTYPKARLVTSFMTPYGSDVMGMCSDTNGDVFVDATPGDGAGGGYVFEYAHGGTTPIAVLSDPAPYGNYAPQGCSVDPTTGNLAVANVEIIPSFYTSNLAVYSGATGSPALYTDPSFSSYNSATYDSSGNLYVLGNSGGSGYRFAELPKGGSSLANISISGEVHSPKWIQWDGNDVAFFGGLQGIKKAAPVIYRVSVSGSSGSLVGKTTFQDTINHAGGGFWIQNGTVIFPAGGGFKRGWQLGFWNYPAGGKALQIVHTKENEAYVSTVSVDPNR